jgi:hypothetical protein
VFFSDILICKNKKATDIGKSAASLHQRMKWDYQFISYLKILFDYIDAKTMTKVSSKFYFDSFLTFILDADFGLDL